MEEEAPAGVLRDQFGKDRFQNDLEDALIGSGSFKDVYLLKIGNEYYAHSDEPLDCTFDRNMRYIIQGYIDKNGIQDKHTTELGVGLAWNRILKNKKTRLQYLAQIYYSAFELTYIGSGTTDAVQSVITKDYKFKRIDFSFLYGKKGFEADVLTYKLFDLNQLFQFNLKDIAFNVQTTINEKRVTPWYSINAGANNKTINGHMILLQTFIENVCKEYDISLTGTRDPSSNYLRLTRPQYDKKGAFFLETYQRKTGKTVSQKELDDGWAEFQTTFNTFGPFFTHALQKLEVVWQTNKEFRDLVDLQFKWVIENTPTHLKNKRFKPRPPLINLVTSSESSSSESSSKPSSKSSSVEKTTFVDRHANEDRLFISESNSQRAHRGFTDPESKKPRLEEGPICTII